MRFRLYVYITGSGRGLKWIVRNLRSSRSKFGLTILLASGDIAF